MSDPLRTGAFPRANAARGRDVLATMALVRALSKDRDGRKLKGQAADKHEAHAAEHAERAASGRARGAAGGAGFTSSFNRKRYGN